MESLTSESLATASEGDPPADYAITDAGFSKLDATASEGDPPADPDAGFSKKPKLDKEATWPSCRMLVTASKPLGALQDRTMREPAFQECKISKMYI
jgi:hypothetical protein